MSGIMEQLLSKADVLIEALNENTKARLAGVGDAPATEKPKATRTPKEKTPAADAPKTTEAEVSAKFESLKKTLTERGEPVTPLKKIIADLGFTGLADLRQVPAKFDEAMEKLTAFEATLGTAADEDDDL